MLDEGLTPKDVARFVEVSVQNVNNWLKGRNGPNANASKKLADYFTVPNSFLHTQDVEKIREYRKKHDRSAAELVDYTTQREQTAQREQTIQIDVGDTMRKIDAKTDVILTALSELLADKKKKLSALVLSDLKKLVDRQLSLNEQAQRSE